MDNISDIVSVDSTSDSVPADNTSDSAFVNKTSDSVSEDQMLDSVLVDKMSDSVLVDNTSDSVLVNTSDIVLADNTWDFVPVFGVRVLITSGQIKLLVVDIFFYFYPSINHKKWTKIRKESNFNIHIRNSRNSCSREILDNSKGYHNSNRIAGFPEGCH